MTVTDDFIDSRKLSTRDVLLRILRKPYNENISIITNPGEANKFMGRLRTSLTRVKARISDQGKNAKPLTINVVEIIEQENKDLLILYKQKSRSSLIDPLGDLVNELGGTTIAQEQV